MKDRPFRHRIEHGLYLALKGFLRALPARGDRTFGSALGRFAHAVDGRNRHIVAAHMTWRSPASLRPNATGWSVSASATSAPHSAIAVSSTRFDAQEICRRFTLGNWEHIEAAESLGKGISSSHRPKWLLGAGAGGPRPLPGGPSASSVRPADNPWLNRELESTPRPLRQPEPAQTRRGARNAGSHPPTAAGWAS